MIGFLSGVLFEVDGNVGIIKTQGGVGYEVFLTTKCLSRYRQGSKIEIYTHLQVREDANVLFGFFEKKEYKLFKLLLHVPGVGPKTSFSIVSFSNYEDVEKAVKENNVETLAKIPGLGKKTAMKIILELSQKFNQEFKMEKLYMSEDEKTVVDALVALGFKSHEAKKTLSSLPKELTLEEKIKEALKLVK